MDSSKFRYLKSGDTDLYALVSKAGERLVLDRFTWLALRNFACCVGGWDPRGTEPPEGWDQSQPWSGAYDTTQGQLVSDLDALALANSLAAASFDILSVLDQVQAAETEVQQARSNAPPGPQSQPPFPSFSALARQEVLEARMQSSIQEFREFFRKGAFRIQPLPLKWELVRGEEVLGIVTLDKLQPDLPTLVGSWEAGPGYDSVKPLFDEVDDLLGAEGSDDEIDELQERIREPGVWLRSLENSDELELFVVIITGDRVILRE